MSSILLAGFCAVWLNSAAMAEIVDVFFVGGQSNAVAGVFDAGIASGLTASGRYSSFEMVHVNHPGTPMWKWVTYHPSTQTYTRGEFYQTDFYNSSGLAVLQQKISQIQAAGHTPRLGLFWFQGESDTGQQHAVDQYRGQFLALLDFIRSDFGLPEPIPFAIAIIDANPFAADALSPDRLLLVEQMRIVQAALGADFDHGVAVDSRPYPRSDTWHLLRNSSDQPDLYDFGVEMGIAFAQNVPEPTGCAVLGAFCLLIRCRPRSIVHITTGGH